MENLTDINTTTAAALYVESLSADDATWVLISTFIIFTMQSGFGLLESGSVNHKNSVNIMYKNSCDIIFGGMMYWFIGYGLQFGDWPGWANSFCGVGRFAVDITNDAEMGDVFVTYVFQLSFACTATTIVSGAMAERVKLPAYIVFAFLNPGFGYSIPAHWIWDGLGWLNSRGVVDIAGSGVVHLSGGAAAFVAAVMLGPRKGRYSKKKPRNAKPGAPANIILGTFILWWGWLGFNCGSTFGVQGGLWRLAGKSAITTLNASMGGGIAGIVVTLISTRGHFGVADMCNGVLGGLVAITAPCAVVRPWEAIVIGVIGGLLAVGSTRLMDKMHVDDPVGAVSVHGVAGVWGLLSVGFFMDVDAVSGLNNGQVGVFHGGSGYSLGIQAAAAASIIAWSATFTFIVLLVLKYTIGIRMSEEDEDLGADIVEHESPPFDLSNFVIERGQNNELQLIRKTACGKIPRSYSISKNVESPVGIPDSKQNGSFGDISNDTNISTVYVVDDNPKSLTSYDF